MNETTTLNKKTRKSQTVGEVATFEKNPCTMLAVYVKNNLSYNGWPWEKRGSQFDDENLVIASLSMFRP